MTEIKKEAYRNGKIKIFGLIAIVLILGGFVISQIGKQRTEQVKEQHEATVVSSQQPTTERFDKIIERMVSAINSEDYKGIQQDFAKVMLKEFPLKKSKPFFKDLLADCGRIKKIGSPRFTPPDQAVYPVYFEKEILDITIVLDNYDKIIGLLFLPHTPDIFVPENHKTELSLPFKDSWLVAWGGDTLELNQHHNTTNQRYAFDFIGVDEKGNTHKDDGRKNEDYFAFGREILAPADGVVTDVIDGVRDNVPGSMNPYSSIGNTVFIQHQEYEVSVLAHLKCNSIKVKVGDRVKKGQVIGLCGNSGNSSEPHLHFHLQNTPIIQDGIGIKCYFQKVILLNNGKKEVKTDYSPIKGDVIISNIYSYVEYKKVVK